MILYDRDDERRGGGLNDGPSDLQLSIEAEAQRDGAARFRDSENKLAERGAAADTSWGRDLVAVAIDRLRDRLRDERERAMTKAGVLHTVIPMFAFLTDEEVALYATRSIFNDIFPRSNASEPSICINLGDWLQAEVQAKIIRKAVGPLYKTLEDRLAKSSSGKSAAFRKAKLRDAAKKYGLAIAGWSNTDKVKVGRFLLYHFQDTTGFVEIRPGGFRHPRRVTPTEAVSQYIKQSKERHEAFLPLLLPMVVEPKPWNKITGGGYVSLNRVRDGLVSTGDKRHKKLLEAADLRPVFECVNRIQETPWRVNRWVLATLLEVDRLGWPVAGTLPGDDVPIPGTLGVFATEQEWKARNAQAKRAYEVNERKKEVRERADAICGIAEKFEKYDAIYFPHKLDFRGRIYAEPSHLNPQGSDMAKGLLEFAQGKPLGEAGGRWLMIHAANCFGIDKCSYADRVAWATEHLNRMASIAHDPISDPWWIEADGGEKAWQFLAACRAIGGLASEGTAYVCHLPVSVDGSNNGLQHFSAMLRDSSCGSLVNLVPSEKPADIYSTVAQKVAESLNRHRQEDEFASRWLAFGVTRKVCKKPVMIVPYGGTEDGVRESLIETIVDSGSTVFNQEIGDAAKYLKQIIWREMEKLMPGAMQAMKWLQDAAREVAKAGKLVTWTSPSGFVAQQSYYEAKFSRVTCFVAGRTFRMKVRTGNSPKIDKKKQAQSFSPNFVHSLDAAALTLTVNEAARAGVSHFTCVHDSFGTHACDVPKLQMCLREVFVRIYAGDVLQNLKQQLEAQLGRELPEPPKQGGLDLELVRASDYFFH